MTLTEKFTQSDKSVLYLEKVNLLESRWYFPVRYRLAVLLFFGTCASYMIKTNMSLTMVAMMNKTAIRSLENDCSIPTDSWCVNDSTPSTFAETSCPLLDDNVTNNSTDNDGQQVEGTFIWKSGMQGVIVGSLFYGFASTNLIGGGLADRFGPKWLIGGGVLLGSILTSLVPMVAELGEWYLVALRVVIGMTQGGILPCIASLFKRWVPADEKSRFFALCTAGAFVGMALCMPMVGYLCEQTAFANGWPSVFYTLGAIGTIWSLIWMLLAHNDPSTHPSISQEERKYIMDNLPVVRSQCKNDFPWKAVLTSIPVWSLIFAWCVNSAIFWIKVTELPNYLDQVLHLPIAQNGNINAVANFVPLIFSVTGSFASDYLISNKKLKKITVRKMFECFATLGSCAFLMLVTVIGCDHTSAIAFLTLSGGFQGFGSSAGSVLPMDIAPTLSGTIFGIVSTFGSLVGFACPTIIGYILDIQGTTLMDKWHYVFYFTSGWGVLGSLVVVIFWEAEVQHWDPSSHASDDCENPSVQDNQELVSNEQR